MALSKKQFLRKYKHAKKINAFTERKIKDLDALYGHKLQTGQYNRNLGLAAPPKVLHDPKQQADFRSATLDMLSNIKITKGKTRNVLSEFSSIYTIGIVTDIQHSKRSGYQILIDRPLIIAGTFKGQTIETPNLNRKVDSHIWINLDRVIACTTNMLTLPVISIGDTINFQASIKEYKGHVDGHWVTKYGLENIIIHGCGIPVAQHNGPARLTSLFNRFGDWIVKFTKLTTIEKGQILRSSDIKPSQVKIKKSNWVHYRKRMDMINERIASQSQEK